MRGSISVLASVCTKVPVRTGIKLQITMQSGSPFGASKSDLIQLCTQLYRELGLES